jgi:toxin YoeB
VRLVFTDHGGEDYQHWVTNDRRTLKRLNRLIEDTLRSPFEGIGKPEPLQHLLAGVWSRRVDDEHRLVYLVNDDDLVIVQARYHYAK